MTPFATSVDLMFAGPMAQDAVYAPGGGTPRDGTVRVIPSSPDVATTVYEVSAISATVAVQVRVSDVAALAPGDTLTLEDGGVLRISGKPRRDATRLTWLAGAVEV